MGQILRLNPCALFIWVNRKLRIYKLFSSLVHIVSFRVLFLLTFKLFDGILRLCSRQIVSSWRNVMLIIRNGSKYVRSPRSEETTDTLHAILRVKEGRHCIEQILVPVQIFLLFNQVQFELLAHWLILQRVIVLDISDQIFAQVARITHLNQRVVSRTQRPILEIIRNWLVKVKHFNNVLLGTSSPSSVRRMTSCLWYLPLVIILVVAALFAATFNTWFQVSIGPHLVFPRRQSVLISSGASCAHLTNWASQIRVLLAGHLRFNCIQIFLRSAHSLHQLKVLLLHVLVSLA